MKFFSTRDRPVHLGQHPFETLRRSSTEAEARQLTDSPIETPDSVYGRIAADYLRLFDRHRDGDVARQRAPVDSSPPAITRVLKSTAYFLDADHAGSGEHALVIVVRSAAMVEPDNPASTWAAECDEVRSAVRAAEIACIVAGYVRLLGFSARAHTRTASDVSLEALALEAGVLVFRGGELLHPFFETRFSLAAVTTELDLEPDGPLARTVVSRPDHRRHRKASDLGPYPMEQIRRVDRPTTLILDDEVPRVPLRAQFFNRARRGDLGDKAKAESNRFATKHPLAYAMRPVFRDLVPIQTGPASSSPVITGAPRTPADNARAVKSLGYYLDADAVGICEAPEYAWYSHDRDGAPLEPRHRFAVVILIDQGHDTMEAASGDDWMSGAQSMRAYLRGAVIAGQLAATIRALGFEADSHTNLASGVLHIPLILLAGLGELSRIGELVLHPFLGARFKSVVVTTDMPLEVDRPIDFALQDVCSKCMKCARECPVSAISTGDKVMFNGYEMWKPDVERCTRYRVTNPYGSACGRCMKMCPYTNEGLYAHRALVSLSIRFPWLRRPLVWLDDAIGHGERNPVKKWWHDLEVRDGVAVEPAGVHARNLNKERLYRIQTPPPISYHHASMMPSPHASGPVPVDRRAGLEAAKIVETPANARERRRLAAPPPSHYRPRSAE